MDGIFDDAAKIEDEIFGFVQNKRNNSFNSDFSKSSQNSNFYENKNDLSIDSFTVIKQIDNQ